MKITKQESGNARVKILVEIPKEEFAEKVKEVEKVLLKKVKVDGFREGNVPEDIARKHIDPMLILDTAAQQLIQEKYGDILQETKVHPIGNPQVHIQKIAQGENLVFSIETDVIPEIRKLADYTKIAKELPQQEHEVSVSDEELQKALVTFRRMKAQQEQKEGEEKSWNDIPENELPELDDAFVKKLGNFDSVKDFTEKIQENLVKEKEIKEQEKTRLALIEKLIEGTEVELPETLVEHELNKMLHEFESNIVMTGISFDDYLKSINKTRDNYKKEWRDQAIKRATLQLILDAIAKKENLRASEENIEKEVENLLERYKDQGIDENIVRAYVTQVLTHQKVFDFLEGKKEGGEEESSQKPVDTKRDV